MTFNPIGNLMLSLFVFLIVVLLCLQDKKNNTNENGNIEEIQDESESTEELDPRSSFDYIIGSYFDRDYKEGFFMIYKKLLDKVSDISMDPRCNPDDFEKYGDLTSEFFSFCAKSESYTYELFDYRHYGAIDTSRLQSIMNLDENQLRLEVNRAKRALNSNDANCIFNHFDLETVLNAVVYYSFARPEESEYLKVRELSKRFCKQEKTDFLICDIYMEHKKGNGMQMKEIVRKLLEQESMQSNAITIGKMFCLASALHWMGEKEAEELLLSSRY